MARPPVLQVPAEGIVLDFGNGIRIVLNRAGATHTSQPIAVARRRAGRKPSPATQAVVQAMQADRDAGKMRGRGDYLAVLRGAGHVGSDQSAGLILAREAKRVFGRGLGRGKKPSSTTNRGPGRQPSPATGLLRERLASDKAKGTLREASHYVRWVIDQPGVKLGLKAARPIVYRELRAAKL